MPLLRRRSSDPPEPLPVLGIEVVETPLVRVEDQAVAGSSRPDHLHRISCCRLGRFHPGILTPIGRADRVDYPVGGWGLGTCGSTTFTLPVDEVLTVVPAPLEAEAEPLIFTVPDFFFEDRTVNE